VLFVQNYVGGLWTHTWSLAVEEHFYLLLGALVAGLIAAARASRGRAQPFAPVIPIFVGVAGFALAARIVTAVLARPVLALHLTPTHLRLDGLMFGVVLSYLFHFHSRALALHVRTHRSAIVLLCVACLGPSLLAPVTSVFMETIGFSLLYIGFGGVLLLALHRTPRPGVVRAGPRRVTPLALLASGLGWLGVYSYSIYLWHAPVQAWSTIAIARITGWLPPPTVAWVMYFAGAIAVGVLMTWLIERPGLALRERWVAGRTQEQEATAALGRAA
jgi:peptidoglycan/LPS O-acetylase OafA/YrhL